MLTKTATIIDSDISLRKQHSALTDSSKQLGTSCISLKSVLSCEQLQNQIVQLKQKAHQSFMQVIQMQQLHEQQLELLRSEFQQKQSEYQLQLSSLQVKIKQLEYQNAILEKNYRHHACDFGQDDLEIDNIEMITCRQESRLDDSAINTLQEFMECNGHQQRINTIKTQIKSEIESLDVSDREGLSRILKMVDKTFDYVSYLKQQFVGLHERNLQMQRLYEENQNKSKNSKTFYDSLQKETKFMTQHIKRLSNDKMRVQKKLLQTERVMRTLQEKMKKIQTALGKKGIKMDQFFGKGKTNSPTLAQQQDHSMDLNQFIELNFTKFSNISQNQQKNISPFTRINNKH